MDVNKRNLGMTYVVLGSLLLFGSLACIPFGFMLVENALNILSVQSDKTWILIGAAYLLFIDLSVGLVGFFMFKDGKKIIKEVRNTRSANVIARLT